MGEAASFVVIGSILLVLGSASFNISYVLITGPIAAVVILATITKRDGESLAAIALRRMRWSKGKLAGYQALRAGTVVVHADQPRGREGTRQVPGAELLDDRART